MLDGARLDDNVGGIKMELLWENISPTSEFATQTLSLDLSQYKQFLVFSKDNTSSDRTSVLLVWVFYRNPISETDS